MPGYFQRVNKTPKQGAVQQASRAALFAKRGKRDSKWGRKRTPTNHAQAIHYEAAMQLSCHCSLPATGTVAFNLQPTNLVNSRYAYSSDRRQSQDRVCEVITFYTKLIFFAGCPCLPISALEAQEESFRSNLATLD